MKKKKRGFTLTELIGIIVILAVIALITVPSYNSVRKKTLEKQYKNLITLIETEAVKFAAKRGSSLTNVQELIDEGYLETDDGTYIFNPVNKEKLNCNLIELNYKDGNYNSKFLEEKNCDLEAAKRDKLKITIVVTGEDTKDVYSDSDAWLNENVILSIEKSDDVEGEEFLGYRWLTASGISGNLSTLALKTVNVLNTSVNVEVTTASSMKLFASTNIKIDKEKPIIKSVTQSDGNDWASGRDVVVEATDQYGSGIAGYYVGTDPNCDSGEVTFESSSDTSYKVNIESKYIYNETDYYVCVKDNVGNINKYSGDLKLQVKDTTAPECVWTGENTTWTNNPVRITVGCSDSESGCTTSSYTKTYDTTTKIGSITYKITDNAGNSTNCNRNDLNVYVDTTKPTAITIDNPTGGNWTNETFSLNLSSSDADSGVEYWYYKYADTEWKKYDFKRTYDGVEYEFNSYEQEDFTTSKFTAERNELAYIQVCDKAGNCRSSNTMIKLDTTIPGNTSSRIRKTNSSGSEISNSNIWRNYTVWWGEFSSSAGDGSPIDHYEYSTNCTGSKSGTLNNSYTYSSNRNTTYCIRAVDEAGNKGNWSSAYYFKIDKTAPDAPEIDNPYENTWAYQAYDISITATDNLSGIDHYEWTYNEDATETGNDAYTYWKIKTNSASESVTMNFSAERNQYAYIRVCDEAGNCSSKAQTLIKIDKCSSTTPTYGIWSTCSNGTKTRTITYKGISGKTCSTATDTATCGATVTVTGNISKWVCGTCKTYCSSAQVQSGDSCLKSNDGYYGNTMGKVTYTSTGNKATFTYQIIQGNETYINVGYWVKFIIRDNSSSVLYETYLKASDGAKWATGSTHTGTVSYTFNTAGTYYIYIEGNSNNPNFNMNFGTIKVTVS